MNKPTISIVVALGNKDRAIGKNNALLWHIPADMKRFRDITTGHPVIMGRNTYESLPGKYRPLPNRPNIVITRQKDYPVPKGVYLAHSLEEALEQAKKLDNEEIYITGGAQIYAQALPIVHKLYLTIVYTDAQGDTFFPDYTKEFTKETYRGDGEHEGLKYTFINLKRE